MGSDACDASLARGLPLAVSRPPPPLADCTPPPSPATTVCAAVASLSRSPGLLLAAPSGLRACSTLCLAVNGSKGRLQLAGRASPPRARRGDAEAGRVLCAGASEERLGASDALARRPCDLSAGTGETLLPPSRDGGGALPHAKAGEGSACGLSAESVAATRSLLREAARCCEAETGENVARPLPPARDGVGALPRAGPDETRRRVSGWRPAAEDGALWRAAAEGGARVCAAAADREGGALW